MIASLLAAGLLAMVQAAAVGALAGPRTFADPSLAGTRDASGTAVPAPASRLPAPAPPAEDSATTAPSADTVVVLPGVRVEAERVPTAARRRLPTASVTEVTAGVSGRALETVADLLAEVPGARVQQYGGLGAFSTVSLRGAPPGQVAIFLDGTPLSSAAHGVVSLGDLPATAIERIEVYRGLSPLSLGAAAPGGALNLVTVSSPELRRVSLVRGAFSTWEGRGSVGGRRGPLAALVHAGHQRSRGDFAYPDDNGTPFNPADDGPSLRLNNHFAATTLLASVTWHPGGAWRLGVREDLFHKAQGVPGIGAVPALETHLAFTRALSQLEATHPGAGPRPGVSLAAGLTREGTQFRDPRAELGLGRHDTDDHLSGEHASLELEWAELPGGLTVTMAGSLREERSRRADAADGYADPPPSRRATAGAGAVVQWRPLGPRLVVHAGARRDRLRDRIHWVEAGGIARASEVRRTLDSPQLGIRVAAARRLELRANWTDTRRAPDFLELFGNQGSVLGNPALRPERSRHRDVGLAWSWRGREGLSLTLDAAHFETRAEDLVVYLRHSQSSVRAQNISRARLSGQEVAVRLDTPAGLSLAAGLTHLRSRDEGPVPFWNGRRLPLRPEGVGFVRLDGRRGRLRAGADVQYIGADFLDRANLQSVPDRVLVGASLAFTPRAGTTRFIVEGRNLGDDRVSDVAGFPLPGRAVFVSCELRLAASPTTR